MAIETVYADAHITGTVTTPENAVGSTTGTWAGSVNVNVNATSRWSMANPVNPLTAGATQSVSVVTRKGSNTGNPSVSVNLWQNGALVQALVPATAITSTTGETLIGTFSTASVADGTGVEIEVVIVGNGGKGTVVNSAQVDTIAWAADTTVAVVGGSGTPLSNTAEGVGAAGTVVTTGLSASGGNAFSTVYSAEGSSVIVGSNGAQGSASSYRLAQPTAGTATGSASVRWNPAISSVGTDVYGGFDLRMAALPSGSVSVLDARKASPSARRFRIDYGTIDNKLRITNSGGTTQVAAPTALVLDSWVTVHWRFLANTSVEMRVYHDPASATYETVTWSPADGTLIGADVDAFWYGNVISNSSFDYQLDNLSAGQPTWPTRSLVGVGPIFPWSGIAPGRPWMGLGADGDTWKGV